MNNNKVYTLGYYVGEKIGIALRFFFSLLFCGFVTATKRYKYILYIYLFLIFLFIISSQMETENSSVYILFIFLVALWSGLSIKFKDYPQYKRIKAFNKMFEQINLKGLDGNYPIFLYEDNYSEYTNIIAFQALTPLALWESKTEIIEMFLNVKIVDIRKDMNNYKTIYIKYQCESLPELITWTDDYISTDDTLVLGVGLNGQFELDLNKYAHTLIAGETGSGKSNILKCLIHQSIKKDYDIILIDFKRGVSFYDFDNKMNVIYTYKSAVSTLETLVKVTEDRLDLFRNFKVDNISDYNDFSLKPLKRKIVFIDELAELLKTSDKAISKSLYESLETLTRLSRAVGINLIIGIQRPDSTIINGQIKNNISFRLCGRFVDREPSRIMLACDDASTLPNIKGRFLAKTDSLDVIQCFYYPKQNIEYNKNGVPFYEDKKIELDKTEELKSDFSFDFTDMS